MPKIKLINLTKRWGNFYAVDDLNLEIEDIGAIYKANININKINVVGGIKISDTATDLAIILSIASNFKNFIIDSKTLILGEVGLTGEIRAISYCEKRIAEAEKMGFDYCLIPATNMDSITIKTRVKLIPVKNVNQAIKCLARINEIRQNENK